MAPSDPPTSITLRIKVAPGHIADGTDEFTLGTSVPTSAHMGQVRQRIQQIVPSNPPPERQRLLYAGRALVDDEQSLADALNTKRDPTQTEYVIHLLVKGDGMNNPPVPHQAALNASSRSGSPTQTGSTAADARQPPGSAHPPSSEQPQTWRPHQIIRQHPLPGQHGSPWRSPAQGGSGAPSQFAGMTVRHEQMQTPENGHSHPGTAEAQALPDVTENLRRRFAELDAHERALRSRVESAGADINQQHAPHQHNQGHPDNNHHPQGDRGIHLQGIGPNGQRFTIHQQTLNLPAHGPLGLSSPPGHGAPMGFPGFQLPRGFPGSGPPPGFPRFPMQAPNFGFPSAPHQIHVPPPASSNPAGPSALDRGRQNITDIMQELDILQNAESTTEEQRQHISRLREHTQMLSDYIDPFRLGNQTGTRPREATPGGITAAQGDPSNVRPQPPHSPFSIPLSMLSGRPSPSMQTTDASNITCYLLSSPTGPRAILYAPQHGMYTAGSPAAAPSHTTSTDQDAIPTPTSTAENGQNGDPAAAVANLGDDNAAAAGAAQQAQFPPAAAAAAAAQADPMGAMGPIMAHFWLLLRVLIFAYFLLGSNMGWRRPMILVAVGAAFWLLRAGLFGDGGVLRRWWDGIVQPPQPAAVQQQQQRQQQQQQQDVAPREAHADAANARPARMPTPEELARRLLDQEAQARDARVHWLRERVRPVERAAALFVASLWPGVGEAHVRAREEEERRRAEEEIAARRREEEERRRREEAADEDEKATQTTSELPDTASGEGKSDATAASSAPAVADQTGSNDTQEVKS